MHAALAAIPAAAHHISLRKWRQLLGLLRSITLAVAGAHGKFTRLQHALRQARGRRVPISTEVQDKLSVWNQLVKELPNRPMHLHKLDPFPLTWEGATYTSGTGMGGACKEPEGQWFVWCSSFSTETQDRIVLDTNPKGGVTINDLEIATLLVQVHLFAPKMHTLSHTCISVDDIAVQGWANIGSVSLATAVSPILRNLAFDMVTPYLLLRPADLRRRQHNGRRRLKIDTSNQQDLSSTFCTHLPAEKSLAAAHPSFRVQAADDLHAAQQALSYGFSATAFQKESTAWRQWRKF